MMRHEFEAIFGKEVDSEVYHVVEAIYRDAGWVSDVGGKDQIVEWIRDPKNAEAVLVVSRAWGHECYTMEEAIKGLRQDVAALEKKRQTETVAAKKEIEALEAQVAVAVENAEKWEANARAIHKQIGELATQIEAQEREIIDLRQRWVLCRMQLAGFTQEEIDLVREEEVGDSGA